MVEIVGVLAGVVAAVVAVMAYVRDGRRSGRVVAAGEKGADSPTEPAPIASERAIQPASPSRLASMAAIALGLTVGAASTYVLGLGWIYSIVLGPFALIMWIRLAISARRRV